MGKSIQLCCFSLALLFWACKPDSKYPYAIKDFRKELQPHLVQIVTTGMRENVHRLLKDAADKELEKLGNSEHPILRAAAFNEMRHRKSFDHYKIMMNHLDDTAIISIDAGEWGIWTRTVSDDIIYSSIWENIADKNKTIEAVLTKHNYLQAAYSILASLEPQEKYYPYIKEMAGRNASPLIDNPLPALIGLAKFRKQEDIPFIKKQLLKNSRQMNTDAYRLLREYPDTTYMDVFEKFYSRKFYGSFCRERYPALAEDFINSVAIYKNARSAAILHSIINKKDLGDDCLVKPGWLQNAVARAVWQNPCKAYTRLQKQVAQKIKKSEKEKAMYIDVPFTKNNHQEVIRWERPDQ